MSSVLLNTFGSDHVVPPSREEPLRFELRDPPGFRSCSCSFVFLSLPKQSSFCGGRGWRDSTGTQRALCCWPGVGGRVDGAVRIWLASSTVCPSPAFAHFTVCSSHPGKGFHEKLPYKKAWHGVPVKSRESVLSRVQHLLVSRASSAWLWGLQGN